MTTTSLDTRRRPPGLLSEPQVRCSLAVAAVAVAAMLSGAAGLSLPHAEALLLLVTVVGSATLPTAGAVLVGLSGWAMLTGFSENRFGSLTLAHDDVARLASFIALSVASAVAIRRLTSGRRARR